MKKINFLILALCSTLMIEGNSFATDNKKHPQKIVKKAAHSANTHTAEKKGLNAAVTAAKVLPAHPQNSQAQSPTQESNAGSPGIGSNAVTTSLISGALSSVENKKNSNSNNQNSDNTSSSDEGSN